MKKSTKKAEKKIEKNLNHFDFKCGNTEVAFLSAFNWWRMFFNGFFSFKMENSESLFSGGQETHKWKARVLFKHYIENKQNMWTF